jgi:hypothetical protein
MKSFKEFLLTEMPQYYKGDVIYQKADKFREISLNNIENMNLIYEDTEYVYLVHKERTTGFVFDKVDIEKAIKNPTVTLVRPIMSLALRNVLDGLKQVHRLRIQQGYSRSNITTTWYKNYIKEFGAIVSDTEHLEGGKILWRSFINSGLFNVSLYNTDENKTVMKSIPSDIDDGEIWSSDDSKRNLVMILTLK